jgi:putative tricarboxylic transport membrane protein
MGIAMGKADSYSSLFWLVVSVLICVHAVQLGVGKLSDPGSGFVFLFSGLVIGIFSLMSFVLSVREKGEESPSSFKNVHWGKFMLTLFYILLYGVFLERLGFLLSTFLLLALLLRTIESKRWYVILLVALGGAWGTYGIFELWLHSRLPRGIFGF